MKSKFKSRWDGSKKDLNMLFFGRSRKFEGYRVMSNSTNDVIREIRENRERRIVCV